MRHVKIKNSFYHEDHIVAVKRIRSFRDDHGKLISYVVRITEDAAGDDNPRHANVWCTAEDVDDFLVKLRLPKTTIRRSDPGPEPETDDHDSENGEPCPIQDSFSVT